ncbi:MAG: class I SAM-dependent methyltransferase [Nitrospirae bacterium]|nr:class I SAM-dependent methyltransferase [Nitrospirota bacterium]MBI5694194.1 class I SAM-dependent methyltransferase [Nitrospirota bacterium]
MMRIAGYMKYYAWKLARRYLGIGQEEGLDSVRKNWEAIGRHDPLWGVLTDPSKRGGRWDEAEFYATGKAEAARVAEYVRRMAPGHSFGRALDFGCGVGRLSFALAEHYGSVDGVDISKDMLHLAEKNNRFGGRVRFTLNTRCVLPFEDGVFDLVYSNIVLQHMDKKDALGYVREFIRVVRPGGLAVFQAPDGDRGRGEAKSTTPVMTPGGVFTISMNVIPRREVEDAVAGAGGRLLDVVADGAAGEGFESARYCASKDARFPGGVDRRVA